jgi:hypothetical protein
MTIVKTVPFQSGEGLALVVLRALHVVEVLPEVFAHAAMPVTEAIATTTEYLLLMAAEGDRSLRERNGKQDLARCTGELLTDEPRAAHRRNGRRSMTICTLLTDGPRAAHRRAATVH